jgi:hypothetical protein
LRLEKEMTQLDSEFSDISILDNYLHHDCKKLVNFSKGKTLNLETNIIIVHV